jgi:hypothetical protein
LTAFERLAVCLSAVLAGWVYVSAWAWPESIRHSHLSEAWAGYALALFLFGVVVRRAPYTWSALVVLLVTIFHVLCFDLWAMPLPMQVLSILFLLFLVIGLFGVVIWRVIVALENSPKNL